MRAARLNPQKENQTRPNHRGNANAANFGKSKMKILKDQWTPLFDSLRAKVSPLGRRQFLSSLIEDLESITIRNFGAYGLARPESWDLLNPNYAKKYHKGDRTPKLILTGEMVESFTVNVSDSSATLTNLAPYADDQQFGDSAKSLPARPFYPVTTDGESLTPFAELRLVEIVEKHFQV